MSVETDQPPGAVNRRRFMQVVAAGAVGAAGTTGLSQQSQAIAPIAVAGAAVGAAAVGATVGWTLREAEILGSDDAPEGLTPSALETSIYDSARTRESTNASTFVDNRNLVGGIEHAAYADGKIAAIEELNNESTQQAVQDAAVAQVNTYETTVISNLLKGWNESVREFRNLLGTGINHNDYDPWNVIRPNNPDQWGNGGSYPAQSWGGYNETTSQINLPNGETFQLERLDVLVTDYDGVDQPAWWTPYDYTEQTDGDNTTITTDDLQIQVIGDTNFTYLSYDVWSSLVSEIETTFNNVRDGLITWVDGTYSQVQSGDLNTEDLLTSRELAAMTTDEDQFNQAVADLMALNIPVDLEREAEISLSEIDATLYGQLATTSETTINAGDTVTPSSDDVDYYFTYDVSQGHGTWTDHEGALDGGVLTFTSEPLPATVFEVSTTAGETATVTAEDFTHDESNGVWTVDLSPQLEDAIVDIDEISFYADVESAQFETIQLDQSFTVESITDSEGNEVDQISTSPGNEPQDDTNYITEDEWQQMEQNQQELIEQYEQSRGGGAVGDWLGGWSISAENGGLIAALALAAGSLLAAAKAW